MKERIKIMLEGITVLNESVGYDFNKLFLLGLLFTVIAFTFLLFILECETGKQSTFCLLAMFSFAILSVLTFNAATKEFTQYEVTIDESVNLKEFNKSYEIIEQRGEIYIIKEINIEE